MEPSRIGKWLYLGLKQKETLLKIHQALSLFAIFLWVIGITGGMNPGELAREELGITLLLIGLLVLAGGGKNGKTEQEPFFKLFFVNALLWILFFPQGLLASLKTGEMPKTIRFFFQSFAFLLSLALITGILKKPRCRELLPQRITGFQKSRESKEAKAGDIHLCRVGEPPGKTEEEILPLKDRFLHMLILGPTGCGKTSRLLIPMILQDVQNPNCGITVIEPKGDLAVKAYMLAKHSGRKDVLYFDPSLENCPKFNPLSGKEADVVENMSVAFKMLKPDTPQYYLDLEDNLLRDAVKVLKRMAFYFKSDGKYANMINLDRFLFDKENYGSKLVEKLRDRVHDERVDDPELMDILAWFEKEYFSRKGKIYDNTGGIRSQVSKLNSNVYVRRVLNPDYERGEGNEIRFDTHLSGGSVLCISTAQGFLRDLSGYLGYFLILNLQSAVFRREGTEETRSPHFLYIDEFQTYSTPAFSDMLTQGRSYRVGSILATQARAQMAMGGGRDGKNFVEVVSSNARNVVLFPGISAADAKYYSEQFGEYEREEEVVSKSRKTFNLFTGGLTPLGHPGESIRTEKKTVRHFTPTDLIYGTHPGKGFGEIVYSLVQNNSLQPAKSGQVDFIPKDLNDSLDLEIARYRKEYDFPKTADLIRNLKEEQDTGREKDSISEKNRKTEKEEREVDYF